jgi:3-methyl-2-oxobutanoate hydroxymethyltransferase
MSETLYGTSSTRRITIRDLQNAKLAGDRWPMLTAYDYSTAQVFDAAGVPVLLVGDSAANVIYGYDTTVPVTTEELLPLVRGVSRGASRALVVADLPFGSYQVSPQQALETASRFLKEGGAQAVKLEGGARIAPQVELLTAAGIPVMGHIGLTPQSVNTLSGYRVQGRGNDAQRLIDDALALQEAGAFSVVLEVVPADVAKEITHLLQIPVIGIGAGVETDAQVLVWHDLAGFRTGGKAAKFVKQYADVAGVLTEAVRQFADEVQSGIYPGEEHTYH